MILFLVLCAMCFITSDTMYGMEEVHERQVITQLDAARLAASSHNENSSYALSSGLIAQIVKRKGGDYGMPNQKEIECVEQLQSEHHDRYVILEQQCFDYLQGNEETTELHHLRQILSEELKKQMLEKKEELENMKNYVERNDECCECGCDPMGYIAPAAIVLFITVLTGAVSNMCWS